MNSENRKLKECQDQRLSIYKKQAEAISKMFKTVVQFKMSDWKVVRSDQTKIGSDSSDAQIH